MSYKSPSTGHDLRPTKSAYASSKRNHTPRVSSTKRNPTLPPSEVSDTRNYTVESQSDEVTETNEQIWTLNSYASKFYWILYPGSPFQLSASYPPQQDPRGKSSAETERGFRTKRQMENAYTKATSGLQIRMNIHDMNERFYTTSRPHTTSNTYRPSALPQCPQTFSRPNTTPTARPNRSSARNISRTSDALTTSSREGARGGWHSASKKGRIVRSSPPWRSLLDRRSHGLREKEDLCPNYCRCCFNKLAQREESSFYRLDEKTTSEYK